jgi:hypothetical protein
VRAEDGCLEYGAAVDVPSGLAVQPPLRPDAVIVVEKWSSLPALEAHLEAPHMAAYRVAVADMLMGAWFGLVPLSRSAFAAATCHSAASVWGEAAGTTSRRAATTSHVSRNDRWTISG